ncbi:MAG: hypothetical protein AAFQ89_17920 [Cyanobacteria bacterium J06626_18]
MVGDAASAEGGSCLGAGRTCLIPYPSSLIASLVADLLEVLIEFEGGLPVN